MAFEKKFSFAVDEGPRVSTQLMVFEGSQDIHFTFKLTGGVDIEGSGHWAYDYEKKSLQLTLHQDLITKAACIANCLGMAIGRGLLECLLKSKQKEDVEDCLKRKALPILADAILCIMDCLNS